MGRNRSNATAAAVKGNLVAGTGVDTSGLLAVGANNTVLTADSAAATGMKWAAAGGAAFSGCSLGISAGITIPTGTVTTITFDTEDFDTDNFHSTSTNTDRITIPAGKAGKYLFTFLAAWQSTSTSSFCRTLFYKNGSTLYYYPTFGNTPGTGTSSVSSILLNLAVGDYITVNLQQNSGGNLTFIPNGVPSVFTATFLGA